MNSPSNILLLTGLACTGKSTLARELKNIFSLKTFEFHAEMRNVARKNGFEKTRHYLEELGTENFLNLAHERLIEKIQLSYEITILIDGVYSEEFISLITALHPTSHVQIITVVSAYQARVARMAKRASLAQSDAKKEIEIYDLIKYQFGIKKVIEKSNFILDNNGTLGEIFTKTTNIINQLPKL